MTASMYRMPVAFGPMPGPRQSPDGTPYDLNDVSGRVSYSVSFLSDRDKVAGLLPAPFELHGEPIVTVEYSFFHQLPWLAGRGYNTLGVKVPAAFSGKNDKVTGPFLCVLWENLADPIISGREELGFNKLYCELPPTRVIGDSEYLRASWDSHPFFSMEITKAKELEPADMPALKIDGMLHHKYIPRTGDWGTADVDYAVMTPFPTGTMRVAKSWSCEGRVSFAHSTFQQLPTLFHIVNAFADLPVIENTGAMITEIVGSSDLSDQRILT